MRKFLSAQNLVLFASLLCFLTTAIITLDINRLYKNGPSNSHKRQKNEYSQNNTYATSKNSSEYCAAPCDTNKKGEPDIIVQSRMADATEKQLIWSIIIGLCSLFISGFVFLSSYFQWRASHRQSRQESMAYVFPHKIETRGIRTDYTFRLTDGDSFGIEVAGENAEALITFKNTGQTPAFKFRHLGMIFPHKPSYTQNVKKSKWWRSKEIVSFNSESPIPPGQRITIPILSAPLKGMRKAALGNGDNYLFLEGMIKYITLGRRIDTKYRFAIMNEDIVIAAGGAIEFKGAKGVLVCEKGNETYNQADFWFEKKKRLNAALSFIWGRSISIFPIVEPM